MAERYGGARGGRLTFKGGEVAVRQSAGKKKKSKKAKSEPKGEAFASADPPEDFAVVVPDDDDAAAGDGGGEDIYTIDAAKRMKYDELFPVEAKKFGYEPKSTAKTKSVEDVLDDRVRKKADRYCK